MMSTDAMHDGVEGTILYDSALILYTFINNKKTKPLEALNKRLMTFDYGKNEKDNKPPEITSCQIKNRFIKMSAKEPFDLL